MTIKKNDFIEIEYTGKVKEDEVIFDTTDEKLAKEQGFAMENATYGPVIICVGQEQVITGLDEKLEGKDLGELTVELTPEEGFGKKSAKLVQLIPTRKFRENKIDPQVGLQINIDGMMGIIKSVSGGRTLVDFNHPLSGKDLIYTVKILRKVEDKNEQLQGYLKTVMNVKDIKTEVKDEKAIVTLKSELAKEIQDEFLKKVQEIIPSIKEIEYKLEEEKESKPEEKKETKEEETATKE